ncbi:Ig-like domain-containing protein, partial [Flavobacterium sp. 7A]|uniref:Ig-like domain-containing protein n=1 Tax=Flavobacterium sp. 7A TaxID=2940571 RepID=UPI00222794EF
MKKNTLNKSKLLNFVFLFLCFFISIKAFSQLPKFTTPTRVSGLDKAVGTKYMYVNVKTVNGVNIDAIVTITAISNAVIVDVDNPTNGGLTDRFQPVINTSAANGYVEYRFDFYKSGTYNTPSQESYDLDDFIIEALDTDGYEFFEIARPNNEPYYLETGTSITVSEVGGFTRFQGPSNSVNPIDIANTQYIAAVYFGSVGSVTFRLGNSDVSFNRQSSISFGEVSFTKRFPPVANADNKLCNSNGTSVSIDVTTNDIDPNKNINKAEVDLDLATDFVNSELIVPNQGTWSVNSSGIVTFKPLSTFKSDPTPIQYTIKDLTGEVSNAAYITITYNPIVSAGSVVCVGSTMTLSPTTGGTWVSSNISKATVTNAGVVTGVAAGNVTFTYTKISSGCSATTSNVTVNPKAIDSDISASDVTICTGDKTTLTASSTIAGAKYKWYTDSELKSPIAGATSASYTTPVLTATTTYYVTVTGTSTCENTSGTAKAVKVTVNRKAIDSDISASDVTICTGDKTTLTASSAIAGAKYKWYTDSELKSPIAGATSASYTTPVLTATTTYYVTVTGTSICENTSGAAKAVTVTVNRKAIDSDISASDVTICTGDKTTLTASSAIAGAKYKWYTDSELKSPIAGATSASYTTPVLTATTTYYVTVSGTSICENTSGAAKAVTVTVNRKAIDSDISASDVTICTGDKTTLTASSAIAGAKYKWYTDSELKSPIAGATSASYTTPVLTATTTYYVTVTGTATCENATNTGKKIIVTVNPKATDSDISASGATICTGATAALSASSRIAGASFKWYTDAALTNEVATTANYTTPALTT